jgi:molybdopterin converting factor small subunit
MRIAVHFYSYFKELTGCEQASVELPPNTSLRDLYQQLISQFPKLAAMEKSTLIAVGVDYQPRDYLLKSGDEVSLFPPVQGG